MNIIKTKSPNAAFKINVDTIERVSCAEGWFEIQFKNGTIVKWRAKSCVTVNNGRPYVGIPPLPDCLLVGGAVPADGKARCKDCGEEFTERNPSFGGYCWTDARKFDAVDDAIKALREIGMFQTEQVVKSALENTTEPELLKDGAKLVQRCLGR